MSFPPHPLQWLELDGEGVADIAVDGAFCPIHWRGHPAREVKTRAQDSLSFGRGARPSRGGFGGTTFVPPESPLAGGTIGGWKEKPGLSAYPQGLAPGLCGWRPGFSNSGTRQASTSFWVTKLCALCVGVG